MTQVERLVEKAGENIAAARLLFADGFHTIAASRAYYAMFYVAEALLFSRGLTFSSHAAVISAYGKEFAKTGDLHPEFHRDLIEAFEIRQIADYRAESSILSAEKVSTIVDRADEFLEAVGFKTLILLGAHAPSLPNIPPNRYFGVRNVGYS